MRESSWRITWDPLGLSPRVMLAFGDLMEREIAIDGQQLTAVGVFDFALSATPSARGNRRRRLDFGKTVGHDSDAAALHECAIQLAAGPWGGSSACVIEIKPERGSSLLMRAALLSSSHEASASAGIAESVHEWSFRCTKMTFATIGDGIAIIGGWYNPPGGGITIIIPGGSGIVPGDVIHVGGVPGLPAGYYPVGSVGSSGGNTTLTLPSAEPERDKPSQGAPMSIPPVTGGSRSGRYDVIFSGEIKVIGCTDLASYEVWNGTTWAGIAPDSWGRATVPVSFASSINYTAWWGLNDIQPGPPVLDPLTLDGQSKPNGSGIDCAQAGPSKFTVKLRRNGVEISSFTIAPSWASEKNYDGFGPANSSFNHGSHPVLTLVGPGGGSPDDAGIPGQITGGTVTKVEEVTT
ncbi:MAG: hypothetical protein EOP83_22710 [Verrucomicrobiaceae bacterium]|nr:MAG: hypothetical protein EOP83_22710 [Verrucomicrobiaceae bacterium]